MSTAAIANIKVNHVSAPGWAGCRELIVPGSIPAHPPQGFVAYLMQRCTRKHLNNFCVTLLPYPLILLSSRIFTNVLGRKRSNQMF